MTAAGSSASGSCLPDAVLARDLFAE
ncbi:MAG: hypothetical protein RL618_1681, partial [Pseudomonadota bacterium]